MVLHHSEIHSKSTNIFFFPSPLHTHRGRRDKDSTEPFSFITKPTWRLLCFPFISTTVVTFTALNNYWSRTRRDGGLHVPNNGGELRERRQSERSRSITSKRSTEKIQEEKHLDDTHPAQRNKKITNCRFYHCLTYFLFQQKHYFINSPVTKIFSSSRLIPLTLNEFEVVLVG